MSTAPAFLLRMDSTNSLCASISRPTKMQNLVEKVMRVALIPFALLMDLLVNSLRLIGNVLFSLRSWMKCSQTPTLQIPVQAPPSSSDVAIHDSLGQMKSLLKTGIAFATAYAKSKTESEEISPRDSANFQPQEFEAEEDSRQAILLDEDMSLEQLALPESPRQCREESPRGLSTPASVMYSPVPFDSITPSQQPFGSPSTPTSVSTIFTPQTQPSESSSDISTQSPSIVLSLFSPERDDTPATQTMTHTSGEPLSPASPAQAPPPVFHTMLSTPAPISTPALTGALLPSQIAATQPGTSVSTSAATQAINKTTQQIAATHANGTTPADGVPNSMSGLTQVVLSKVSLLKSTRSSSMKAPPVHQSVQVNVALQAPALLKTAPSVKQPVPQLQIPLCTEEQATAVGKLLITMANSNALALSLKVTELKECGNKIKSIHPLSFLMYVFAFQDRISLLKTIFENSTKVFSFLHFSIDDIPSFDTKLSKSSRNGGFEPYLVEFTTRTQTDPKIIREYVRTQKWEAFMKYLIKEAKAPPSPS